MAGVLLLAMFVGTTSSLAQPSQTTEVTMDTVAFAPTTTTVPAGTTVVWTNTSPYEHTVTADDASFDSGLLDEDQTFSVTFEMPGSYPYYCIPHGYQGGFGMAGVIIVE